MYLEKKWVVKEERNQKLLLERPIGVSSKGLVFEQVWAKKEDVDLC